ncbi:transcription termination/antitermination protein NusG [Deferribacter abyssi]|uniref:transcription termination/antitermination protein NusG n=1 Tax=Deferribacter abyssi TaxID=213806 RepID=UPI003C1F5435
MKKKWRCVYCKPKSSKLAKFYLERAGYEVFQPLFKEKKRVVGQLTEVTRELFPNYLFVRFELEDYRLVRYTRGVSKVILGDEGDPAEVPEEIIEYIKDQMKDGFVVLNKDYEKGDKVYITDGPFKGFEAIFLEKIKPKDRVLILLKTISGELKVEIDELCLQTKK